MGKWLDNVARAAAGGLSRREAVRRLGGGFLGTVLAALLGVRTAEAGQSTGGRGNPPNTGGQPRHASGCRPPRRNRPCSDNNRCPEERCYCYRGNCARKKPVGSRCLSDRECLSGVCDDLGYGYGGRVCVEEYSQPVRR